MRTPSRSPIGPLSFSGAHTGTHESASFPFLILSVKFHVSYCTGLAKPVPPLFMLLGSWEQEEDSLPPRPRKPPRSRLWRPALPVLVSPRINTAWNGPAKCQGDVGRIYLTHLYEVDIAAAQKLGGAGFRSRSGELHA